eukprot:gb/GECH01014141.1/.p1 GENE.gb/GECH01014141.1/~~gb/GECH01014141.1/.p1  ORF type:complete len:156 (+),score=43.01 gb/GECH01014141.1/:1-468(+)
MDTFKQILQEHYDFWVAKKPYPGINYKANQIPNSAEEAPSEEPLLSFESSSTVHAISSGLIKYCANENTAFFDCKAKTENPEDCINQALDCRRCTFDLAEKYFDHCPQELAVTATCLSENDNLFERCYEPRVQLEDCMKDKSNVEFVSTPVKPND